MLNRSSRIHQLNKEAMTMSEGTSAIQGRVIDAETRKKLANVVITVTSPSLQGEQNQITDSSGAYRVENLPPGEYTLRAETFEYKPYSRGKITLPVDKVITVNMELLPN
jgi:hypothetical protein